MPEMTPVTSSMIAGVGYDDDARELLVEFTSGATWAYEGVGRESFEDMKAAGSVGQYFLRWIKGKYPERRV